MIVLWFCGLCLVWIVVLVEMGECFLRILRDGFGGVV